MDKPPPARLEGRRPSENDAETDAFFGKMAQGLSHKQ